MTVPLEFPPTVLREYAVLADGERGAVIGPHGDVVWLCVPRWDSDAVFSTLIGGAGVYAVSPVGRYVWGGHYEDGSLIWRSRWVTTDATTECREAMAFPGAPGTAVLLRRVIATDGPARVRVVLDLRAGFGKQRMRELHRDDEGVWSARAGSVRLRWSGGERAEPSGDAGLSLDLHLAPGTHHDLVLELSEEPLGDRVQPEIAWQATEQAWSDAVPGLGEVIGRRDARHAYAVLRGLTSSGGGMVAAATTSLPERAEAGRNYDYRYVWIRDQCYAGQAVAADGAHPLLDDAVRFVAQRLLADGPRLAPAYRVDGARVPDERRLTHLSGYPGGADRVGNWVNEQFQLDSFGEALLLFAAAASRDRLESEHWKAVETAVAAVEQRWREPDAGLWEIDNRRWAHSRLTCAAGLRAVARWGATTTQAAAWSSLADAIVADTAADCLHPSGRWQRSPEDDKVDAALLLPAIRGAVPTDDPRSVATLAAVLADLVRDDYVYRFRQDPRPLSEAEGAFLLCGYLAALAAKQQGRDVQARGWYERGRAACGPSGLYAEEYDVVQRQLRGNLPQAFVHALLLECSVRLATHP